MTSQANLCLCNHPLSDHTDIQTELVGYHKACIKCCCSDFETGNDDAEEDYIHEQ